MCGDAVSEERIYSSVRKGSQDWDISNYVSKASN
jgi:hypothetical protein